MLQKNKMLLLFTLANLMYQILAKGPFSTKLNEEQEWEFSVHCAPRVESLMQYYMDSIKKIIPFIKPCEVCILSHVRLGRVKDEDLRYRGYNDGKDFLTIVPIKITHYQLDCECGFNFSAKEIDESFKKAAQHYLNKSCNEVISHDPMKNFKLDNVEKCFEEVGQDEQGKAHIKLVGENMILNFTTRYSSRTDVAGVIHKNFNYLEPPKAKCKNVSSGDDKVIKACECLSKSKLFHALPYMLTTRLLSCNSDVEQIATSQILNSDDFTCMADYFEALKI